MTSWGSVRAGLAAPFRRRDPVVLWPGESLGVGNLLYLWLRAYTRQNQGESVRALRTAKSSHWAKWFPEAVSAFTIDRADLSFFNPRIVGPLYQRFGEDFSARELEQFIDEFVLRHGSPFGDLVASTEPAGDLAINIRRGDYYSNARFRGRYSFDVVEYVRTALQQARADAPVSRVLIISDDLEWCRLKLAPVLTDVDVVYPDADADPALQLALLAVAPRLILTNSTFSYWAGYLSNRVHAVEGSLPNHGQVYAPWFHSREWNEGEADQVDPRWSIIRTIPGGWDG